VNLCRACGEDFGSLSGFDTHRIGRHEHMLAEGFAMNPPREDGRRCLDAEELEQLGWHQDVHGRWRMPRLEAEMPFWDQQSAKSGDERPSPDQEPIPA
jgi:hypothetical protein